MKLITTLYDINQLDNLLQYADGIMLGHQDTGTRLTRSFSLEDILTAIKHTQKIDKLCYIQANQMFNDDQLDHFKMWIQKLPLKDVSGVVVADLGAYRVLSALGFSDKVIYNPETLMTNTYDFNFLNPKGIQGVYIAKEITLSDIKDIAKDRQYKLFMVGHGHLNMFYSKRQLIDNFQTYQEQPNIYHSDQNLKIIEETRRDEAYPILEDHAGTHVFRSHVFESLSHIKEVETYVDVLVIDTIFKDDLYALKVLYMYHHKTLDDHTKQHLESTYKEVWDQGFFYKKTIYKQKGAL